MLALLFETEPIAAQNQLEKAVSHNDYLQNRPLLDALEEGFTTIEVDIFHYQHKLVVAHWLPFGKTQRTLEKMYLLPLSHFIRDQATSEKGHSKRFTLLIDIKSSPESTYQVLKPLPLKYRWMFSAYENGVFTPGPVTVVLTGRKPEKLISQELNRLVTMDDFLNAPSRLPNADLFAIASCKYSWIIKSKDVLTPKEKLRLRSLVALAHSQHKKARLWASPENDKIRKDLLECGIDLINTDHLKDLKRFLENPGALAVTAP